MFWKNTATTPNKFGQEYRPDDKRCSFRQQSPNAGFRRQLAFILPDRPVAAKTGTTNDYKDAWVLGYTPSFAVGAWFGNNDNTPMEKMVAGFHRRADVE